jgi:CheY-like chemotaxis protein
MTKKKILVVEDEAIVAMDISQRLTRLGYEVVATTRTGEEAIQWTSETRPNLVLMDILLAGKMDGVDAAREIMTRFKIPVVYVTSYSDATTVFRAKLTEPFGYVLKPIEEGELKSVIDIRLYRHELEQEAEPEAI